MIRLLYNKWKFDKSADRIGPDILFTHWRLYFKPLMRKMCKKKFLYFSDTAEIRPGAYIVGCSKISIGDRVTIRPSTMFFADPRENGAGIIIEDNVLLGSGIHFYVNNHRFDILDMPIIDQGHYASKSIRVKSGAWIGANAIILPGIEIGHHSVVAAGAVVTKSVPDYVLVGGVPAQIIRKIE